MASSSSPTPTITREQSHQLQQSYITTFNKVRNAFLKKMRETIPNDSPHIKEQYLSALEKELGNLSQMMSAHLSLIANSSTIKDGLPPVSIHFK